jgi:hypothetical protein
VALGRDDELTGQDRSGQWLRAGEACTGKVLVNREAPPDTGVGRANLNHNLLTVIQLERDDLRKVTRAEETGDWRRTEITGTPLCKVSIIEHNASIHGPHPGP